MVFFQHMNASMNQALCVIEAMRAALLIRERTQSQSRPMTFSRETKVLFRKPFFRISSQIISMGFSSDIGQQRIQLDSFWNPQCSATVSGSVICKQQDVFVRICLGKLFEKHVHASAPCSPSIAWIASMNPFRTWDVPASVRSSYPLGHCCASHRWALRPDECFLPGINFAWRQWVHCLMSRMHMPALSVIWINPHEKTGK